MNRDIKFRAWTKRDKCWCGAFAIHKSGIFRESPKNEWIDLSEQSDIVLMQYTGLKDKNGKEIYEGDIVKGERDIVSVIEFREGRFMCGVWTLYQCIPAEEIEIIGNIYESPELIK